MHWKLALISGCLALGSLFSNSAHAVGGGGGEWLFGGSLGITAASQGDMNTLISRANNREGGISTARLGNAWEIAAFLQYRFAGSFLALQLRPGFFYQSQDGTNSAGDVYEYSVQGYSVFPMVRFYMLENETIRFFSQVGLGFGFADGTIKEGTAEVDFGGHDIGYMFGLGSEFCFGQSGNHCVAIEGNYRFLPIDRVTADSATGTFADDSLSQAALAQEVELDDRDLSITMSGVIGLVGYSFHF